MDEAKKPKNSLWGSIKEGVASAAKTAVAPASAKATMKDGGVAKPDLYGQPGAWKRSLADKKKALTDSAN